MASPNLQRASAHPRWLVPLLLMWFSLVSAFAAELRVGVAARDITPDYPVRLNGFGFRRDESTGVTQKIWAKAIAFADDAEGPAILITTDNLGVPDRITQTVADRLAGPTGLKRERLTITATHTHTAPMLSGVAPTIFGVDIPPEHQERIDRYTREFIDKLVEVALAALADVRPARVEWGTGSVGFAKNRRKQGGPVDHDLPILIVREPDGKVRAVWFSYACHCVTLSNNLLSGDWAGFAQAAIQENHPGCLSLASVGCGADSNPDTGVTGNKVDAAAAQGRQVADEVKRLISAGLQPLTENPRTRLQRIELPLDTPRTRAEWEERAKQAGAIGFHARVNLARLDRGETLQASINYPIQSWTFGRELALVFLPGEVVVDYALRLKREFDRTRLIVAAYANDAPCYIPSERVLTEGGYEGGDAMIYYDRPQKFASGLEQMIVDIVHAQLPEAFAPAKATQGTEGTTPKPPKESQQCIRTKPGLSVELVAAEPLVQSPVAIDWDARGRLWVCEMFDYPTGLDGNWKPGGRIKVLEDTNGDGQFDRATIFAEGLPFPTGVIAWRDGALICAAPDIIYAVDSDGDGRADNLKKLFSGFETNNYQARVNSLCLGLDNWIYGANGLLGGKIRGGKINGELDIRGHDFRMKPDTGEFEAIAGLTQHGRVRDDWDHWFGCENSRMLFQFPIEDRYVARNPRIAGPPPSVNVPTYTDSNRIYAISPAFERYNHPESAGQTTSACGVGLYLDDILGASLRGNAFTCEPVHNLIHREVLASDGIVFTGKRADDEQRSEFLASSDLWFRPVQARTGPDGALYIVDMYRFLIEHPRWIPAERLAKIDVRAGAEMGRIYRVVPQGKELRPIRDLTKLPTPELAAALDTPNATERDRVHLELLRRADRNAEEELTKLIRTASEPAVRVQALAVIEGLGALTPALAEFALHDDNARVRQSAVRITEALLSKQTELPESFSRTLLDRASDPDLGVRYQLALTLGDWKDHRASEVLSKLAAGADAGHDYFRAALLSCGARHPSAIQPLEPKAVRPLLAPASEADLRRLNADPAATAKARASVVDNQLAHLPATGSADRGAELFSRACALCHKQGDLGFDVGPLLQPLRDKPQDYLVKNILDPNAAIEPRFVASILELTDGSTITGLIKSETATSITVAQPGGTGGTLLRSEIRHVTPAKSSMMPEDFENTISAAEMADLLAYLQAVEK